MPHLMVDERKCKADGICADVCPVGIIAMREGKRVPVPTDDADSLCIACGHCVAVCPHGAMSLDVMPAEDCPPMHRDMILTPEQVEHLIRSRRSTRVYRGDPVDDETIRRLIGTARYAPSGHNAQPVEWLVVRQAADVSAMAGLTVDWMRQVLDEDPGLGRAMLFERIIASWEGGRDRVCRGAPHLVFACGDAENPAVPTSCTIALASLELAAPSFALGACWAGYLQVAATRYPPLQETIALPDGKASMGAMMLGYPKYRYKRMPLRKETVITWK